MKKLIILAVVILGFTATSIAQSINVNSKAVIVSTLSIANNNNMDFGSLLASATGGNAILSDDAASTITGTVTKATGGSTPTAAKFTITGAGGSPKITFPSSVSLTGPGTAMVLTLKCKVDGGVSDLVSATSPITFTAGSAIVYMGGSLAVGANQTAGTYQSADFAVTVAY